MASFTAELMAVLVAVVAVAFGCLLGGGSLEASADFSVAIALLGLVVAIGNALTRELRALRDRFGSPVLFSVLQMG